MAYYAMYPVKDTTIYELHPSRNAGIDQILELNKIVPNTPDPDGTYWSNTYNSRILVQFDIAELSSLISSGRVSNQSVFYLSLKATEATDLPVSYSLYAHTVSQSWDNGSGHYHDYPEIKIGASWKYRDGYYEGDGQLWLTGSYNSGTTGSFSYESGGSTWYTGSQFIASQSFDYALTPDIRVNVTSIVNQWLSGSVPNNGFLVKRGEADEKSTTHLGSIKFFSKDTHTIYIPKLEAVWDDSNLVGTGSLTEVGDEYTLYIKNLKKNYRSTSKEKFRIIARDLYPIRTFSTSSNYLSFKRLPTSSFYAIQDSITEDYIVPFDESTTRVSVDTSGNYFTLDMSALLPERFYKIVLKIQQEGTSIERVVDEGFHFKVVR